jgi:opacity protein-like surface antigen
VNKEEFFSNLFLVKIPEYLVGNAWKSGCGSTVWFGTYSKINSNSKSSKTDVPDNTNNSNNNDSANSYAGNFYIGCEASFSYSPVEFEEKKQDDPLWDFQPVMIFNRHGLSGQSTISTDIVCRRIFSAEIAVRFGFGFTPNILVFLKLGIGLNQNTFEQFYVAIKNDISFVRHEDYNTSPPPPNMLSAIPKFVEYKVAPGRQYFFSFNLGCCLEYHVTRNFFFRTEYDCKCGLANKIKIPGSAAPSIRADIKMGTNVDLTRGYSLRYHGIENRISFGIGVKS